MAVRGSNQSKPSAAGLLSVVRDLAVAWKLFFDRRVPMWVKSIPLFSAAYLLWPIDILADPILGLGQLDDLAIIILGLKLFISLCPPNLVEQYRQGASNARYVEEDDIIDTTYRVLDDRE